MTGWRQLAACKGHDPELFYPLPGDNAAREKAIAICAACPVTAQCDALALRSQAHDGVWAGIDRGVANARRSDRLRLARAAAG